MTVILNKKTMLMLVFTGKKISLVWIHKENTKSVKSQQDVTHATCNMQPYLVEVWLVELQAEADDREQQQVVVVMVDRLQVS